ncbi:MAG: hypothetical protein DU429_02715 [Candidatus Tokpelaia sp.]|nr:MAG: hypothetical protein DU430_05465 [Candidatus Tokpelaia sp.]KAA6207384.1 MAG: hypothetical protein DU429_02715 [Candidatus Tokpelaia sp.]
MPLRIIFIFSLLEIAHHSGQSASIGRRQKRQASLGCQKGINMSIEKGAPAPRQERAVVTGKNRRARPAQSRKDLFRSAVSSGRLHCFFPPVYGLAAGY